METNQAVHQSAVCVDGKVQQDTAATFSRLAFGT